MKTSTLTIKGFDKRLHRFFINKMAMIAIRNGEKANVNDYYRKAIIYYMINSKLVKKKELQDLYKERKIYLEK